MKTKSIWAILGFVLGVAVLSASPILVTVHNEVKHELDERLFGQFFERPSASGETGPEAAVDEEGRLPDEIIDMMASLDIPTVRFPAGTDIDYIDWTDMVSNVPGRHPERPITVGLRGDHVTNRFGYDEYFELANDLGWESIIVVNLLDGLARRKPLEEAAMHAAGLVAYCNAPVGAELPESMPDWPAIRAANGHPEPFRARYFQLGNETWIGRYPRTVKASLKENTPENFAARYRETVIAYIQAMKAVDPEIEIIVDLRMGDSINEVVLRDPFIRSQVSYLAYHAYAPMNAANQEFAAYQTGLNPFTQSSEEWRFSLNSMPGAFDEHGQSKAIGRRLALARELGYEVAVTEWNWNGWGLNEIDIDFNHRHAAAVGVAGFLQGMMRQGDIIKLANQSLLVGHGWGIAGIRYDPKGETPTHFNSQIAVTNLYRKHSGSELLEIDITNLPTRVQPYNVGAAGPVEQVALVDILATKDNEYLYLHLVNRDPVEAHSLTFDLSALTVNRQTASFILLEEMSAEDLASAKGWMREDTWELELPGSQLTLEIAPNQIAVVKIAL